MGQGAEQNASSLSQNFGRIITRPDIHDGHPFLIFNGVEVQEIEARFLAGQTDEQILAEYRKTLANDRGRMTQDDLDACRAWQARFEPETLSSIFNRVSGQNVIMLDENMSYKMLYDVVRLFGRSSHVYADGLYDDHNDDERDIWAHVVKNKYAAIITGDNDFKRISHDYRDKMIHKYGSLENCPEHIPAVIFVPHFGSWQDTCDLLEKFAPQIRKYIETNDAICAEVTPRDGFQKIYEVRHFKSPTGPSPLHKEFCKNRAKDKTQEKQEDHGDDSHSWHQKRKRGAKHKGHGPHHHP